MAEQRRDAVGVEPGTVDHELCREVTRAGVHDQGVGAR